jgi:beta-xylosidase
MKKQLVLSLCGLGFAALASAGEITIRNNVPRTDINGAIVDAHAGRLVRFGERYYLYGDNYRNTDGINDAQNYFVCYSSSNLMAWKFEGEIIPKEALPGWKEKTYRYRPHVIYNAKTRKYVLFYNWRPVPQSFAQGNYVVATADAPTGPFTVVERDFQTKQHPTEVGDFNLFVDDDGTAYLAYKIANTAPSNRGANFIERLSADYLRSSGDCSAVVGHGEAIALFKRAGNYYIVYGKDCCYCPEGSNIYVRRADAPLGPYRDNVPSDIRADKLINAQSTHVAEIETADGKAFIYMGDRWRSAPGCAYYKGHDYQYWSEPLRFDEQGNILPIVWKDWWSVRLK